MTRKTSQRNEAEKGGDPRVTIFGQLWYGTAKILTLGPSPLLIFEAQVPSKMADVKDFDQFMHK